MNSGIAEVMGYFPFKPEFSSGLIQAFSFRIAQRLLKQL